MADLSEIIKKRSTPGILILDMNERFLYSNADALDIMPVLKETTATEGMVVPRIREEIIALCRRLREKMAGTADIVDIDRNCMVLESLIGDLYLLRAFPIGHYGERKNPTHIAVLVDRIVEKHEPDFEKAKNEFNLSNREMEVLGCICHGFTNKAISEKLFICEFTVKDHIKKIMRKMNVRSRSEMIALLK
jgi:DNA-binding CsgD family transcriptional regulator